MNKSKDNGKHQDTEPQDKDKYSDTEPLSETTNSKEKYSDTELNSTLLEYFTEHPGTKITFLGLEKATGISRFVWKRRMVADIENLNNRPQDNPNYSGPLEITNVAQPIKEIVKRIIKRMQKSRHYSADYKELDTYLRSVNIAVQNCVSKALGYDELKEQVEKQKTKIEDKDKTIATLKEAIEIANKTHFSSALKTRYHVTKSNKADITDIKRKPKDSAAVALLTQKGVIGIFDDDDNDSKR